MSNRFFWTCIATVAILALGTSSGCSDDSDPVATQCEASCRVAETHACAAQQTKCVADCKALAGQAARDSFGKQRCGVCVATEFGYSGWQCKSTSERCTFGTPTVKCEPRTNCSSSDEECFGAQGPLSLSGPPCGAQCVEPDLGTGR